MQSATAEELKLFGSRGYRFWRAQLNVGDACYIPSDVVVAAATWNQDDAIGVRMSLFMKTSMTRLSYLAI